MNKSHLIACIILIFFKVSIASGQNIESITKEENKFIYDNSIKLFLGDSILVEVANLNETLSGMTVVNSIVDSTITFSIKFSYDKFGLNNASILTVSNPFSKQLSYKAKIRVKPGSKYSESDIFPILPGIYGLEVWPYKIESIIIYDFKLE